MNEFLPQRFRWRSKGYVRWKYGLMLFNHTHEIWEIHTMGLHQMGFWCPFTREAHKGPAPDISKVIGEVSAFEWIDSDNGWPIAGIL